MKLYRIVQDKKRAADISGTGAFRIGGRWNSKGTYMLYTSENSSLAYLESLIHFDKTLMPPQLFIMQLEVDETSPIYTLPSGAYPVGWMKPGLLRNQELGDKWMIEKKYLGIKVKSAINVFEYNYLLNPLFPRYYDLVKIISVTEIEIDNRLVL
ncbi:MAG: RES family NAD+ phosphorylase [Rhizobacter sp.]|nr:RES family NAD+ phosphorylase [Ferruginibacter sp.]